MAFPPGAITAPLRTRLQLCALDLGVEVALALAQAPRGVHPASILPGLHGTTLPQKRVGVADAFCVAHSGVLVSSGFFHYLLAGVCDSLFSLSGKMELSAFMGVWYYLLFLLLFPVLASFSIPCV